MLEDYNKIVPGSADRLLKMAEEQSAHRQYLEKRVINSDIFNSKLGILSALIISLVFFGLAVYLVKNNYPYPAAIVGSVNIGGLVWTFIYGSKSRRAERQNNTVFTDRSILDKLKLLARFADYGIHN